MSCRSVSFSQSGGSIVNLDAIEKIKTEASRQSQLMEVARNITTVSGPRLTNSPNVRAAGEYARKKLVEWKLDDVHLETWNYGSGWSNDKFSMKLASDPALSFLAYSNPDAWDKWTSHGRSCRQPSSQLKRT